MSYTLCVWDAARHVPLPTSHTEAFEIMDRLRTVHDAPNPKLATLGTALLACYDALPMDARPKGGVRGFWGSDPSRDAGDCTVAVYRVIIPADECIERIAAVVTASASLGLVVYDDEIGMCFLPDGTIYPESMREGWAFDLAELTAPPRDPNAPDVRNFLQKFFGALVDVIGSENRRGGY